MPIFKFLTILHPEHSPPVAEFSSSDYLPKRTVCFNKRALEIRIENNKRRHANTTAETTALEELTTALKSYYEEKSKS